MSPRQIDVHPNAVAEARAAAQWYREVTGKLEIVAIAHGRRRPGYWKKRIV